MAIRMSVLQITAALAILSISNVPKAESFSTPFPRHSANLPIACQSRSATRDLTLFARRRNKEDDDEYDMYDDDEYDDFEYEKEERRRRRRRRPTPNFSPMDDLGSNQPVSSGFNLPSPFGNRDGLRLPESVSKALLAGIFVLGIGTGVTVDSAINTNPKDLASRDAVDRNAPNPKLCTTYGASAMAFDQRVFVSFDPFNVYVAQADVKPACVLRSSNVVPVLRSRNLINDKEVRACKDKMNTWAFVGDLEDVPQLTCVYQSEDAQNEFLSDPKLGIGEDVWDDDRASGRLRSTGKLVKDAKKKAALTAPLTNPATDIEM